MNGSHQGTDGGYEHLADYDGRFSFICERGHNIVQNEPLLDACPVPVWPDGSLLVVVGDLPPEAPRCGAEIDYRLVAYEGPGR